MKTRIACNYAVVRFLPYPEAGEFVNIGVVLHSPATGFFDLQLLDAKRTSCVHGFFPELQKEHYRDGLKNCAQELKRMRGEVGIAGKTARRTTMNPAVGGSQLRQAGAAIGRGSRLTGAIRKAHEFIRCVFGDENYRDRTQRGPWRLNLNLRSRWP